MDAITVPKLTVSFAVDLELDYDSFGGKTPEQIAEALQDEMDDLLFEASSSVVGVYTSITAINSDD
jgi:hypothetical protein